MLLGLSTGLTTVGRGGFGAFAGRIDDLTLQLLLPLLGSAGAYD
jgi:hypothetical protein